MKPRLASKLVAGAVFSVTILLGSAPPGFASIDLDANGVSDIWEILYPGAVDPDVDTDDDGVRNRVESVWGTNPLRADRPPHGLSVAFNPARDAIDIRWPGVAGKRYQLQSRPNLGPGDWSNDGEAVDSTGEIVVLSRPSAALGTMYRLQVSDRPSAFEGVTEWEATTIGLNRTTAKAGGDGSGTSSFGDPSNLVTVRASKPVASEDGLEPGEFTITRSGGGTQELMVGFTVSGTATVGLDHTRSNAWIRIPPGVNSVTISVTPREEFFDVLESSEICTLAVTWVLRFDAGVPTSIPPGSPNKASVIINNTTTPSGSGLLAQYFDTASTTYGNSANFDPAQLKVTRVDPTVDFDWLYGTPNGTTKLASADNYSVAWEGYLSNTVSGSYIFQLDADDRARVWLDTGTGLQQILENGWDSAATGTFKQSGSFTLTAPADAASRYHLLVEFVETTNNATCRFQWRIPGTTTFSNIPSGNVFTTNAGTTNGWVARFYSDTNFTTLAGVETNSAITVNNNGIWGSGTPDPLIQPETFSARWTGQVQPQFSEEYTFVVNADDAVKLWINGQPQTLRVAAAANSTGTYSYDSVSGDAVITHSHIPAGSFVVGETVRVDPTSGNFTGGYADYIVTTVGAGTFTINVGAGAFTSGTGNCNIEWLNKPIDWTSASSVSVDRFARISLLGGVRYDIRLEYFENTGIGRCQLSWYSPSQPKQIIPSNRLYPASAPLAPAAFTSQTDATALVGGLFSYTVGGNNGATVTVSNLPPWLTFSGGVISGTPPPGSAGEYQIIITVASASGTGTSVLNLRVTDAGGTVVREYWNGVAGTNVADIPVSAPLTGSNSLSSLQAASNFGDNYGARIRGYITAPVTGNYYFWIAGNNSAELWISNDDELVNAFKRAWVTAGSATPQSWAVEPNQKSPWLALDAGKRYYFEILHKAGAGSGDNLAVGWLKPGQNGSGPSEIVPGYVLSPYVAPPPGSTPGTLYVSTMLSQNGAVTDGVGTSTLRVNEDETVAYMRYSYSGLTGPISSQHIHTDPYLTHASTIVFDIDTPATPGDGLITNTNDPNYGAYKWTITAVGTLSAADIREIIKQGKAYINLHTANYPAGEIRGNYALAIGSRTFTPPPAPPALTDDSNTDAGAVRFLTQATYGPNIGDIQALKALTASGSGSYASSRYHTWITNQFSLPVSRQLPEVLARELSDAGGGGQFDESLTFNAWWRNAVTGPDQLRQRIAFALSEIHVVSADGPLDNRAEALSHFYDALAENAFGNFRDIIEATTLTPAMGRYLDMLRNDKPDQTVGRIPNENYAREIMQLFSVGLFRVWPDGTLILNSKDAPIDTYTQREIVGVSHVFTGWDYNYAGTRTTLGAGANWTNFMKVVPARHFTGPKRVLNNEVLPGLASVGGQPLDAFATHNSTHYNDAAYLALPDQELDAVHDQLFNHPNTGPFICRQLIQRLVTSHPSRDYLYRVVQKFNDNGSGVRGDMQAVVKAILLDYEARSRDMYDTFTVSPGVTNFAKASYGKQREPVMRVAAAARAFRLDGTNGTYSQSGSHVITVNVPNKLTAGRSVFLEFPGGPFTPGDTNPSSALYTVLTTPAPSAGTFYVNAKGWAGVSGSDGSANGGITGTYSQSVGSSNLTVTLSGHWLPAGGKAYLDFESQTGGAMTDDVYTAATSTSTTGGGSTFTIAMGDTLARSGRVRMVGFRGSYTVSNNTGGPVGQEKRITLDTIDWTSPNPIANHHLNVGDSVFLNFTAGNPQPTDNEFIVESVPDANTFTVLTSTAIATQGGANDADNGMWMFPLVNQPTVRSGSINLLAGTFNMGNTDSDLDQSPLNSPTVFNFFLPDFKFPGALASQGLTTPEFQVTAETTVVRQNNFLYNGLFNPSTDSVSSFKSGTHAMTMDFSPWMAATAADLGLGAPANGAVPWTHNQNIGTLVDQLSTLLVAGQLSAGGKAVVSNFVALRIASIGTGNPCLVTTVTNHNLTNGSAILLSGVTAGTFSPVGAFGDTSTTRTITSNSPTTFTVTGVNCTAAPNAAGLANAHVSVVQYNNGTATPTDTHKRNRLRAIIHLILTSPDFTIQR